MRERRPQQVGEAEGATPMNEELFWQIVASAQGSAEKLKQRLLACSKEEMVSFHQLLDEVLYQLDREEIHEITDGSDDGFEYVRLWIVSQGRSYFEAVLQDPAQAPHDADENQENEAFGYAAREAYEEKWGEAFPQMQSQRVTGTNPEGWP
jgi:hypothetical protein